NGTLIEIASASGQGLVDIAYAGAPHADDLAEYGLTQFAMDDHLLVLVRTASIFQAVSQLSDTAGHADAIPLLTQILALIRDRGIEVRSSKRLLQILWGITGFRPSPALFAERVVATAARLDANLLAAAFRPLLDQASGAIERLRASA